MCEIHFLWKIFFVCYSLSEHSRVFYSDRMAFDRLSYISKYSSFFTYALFDYMNVREDIFKLFEAKTYLKISSYLKYISLFLTVVTRKHSNQYNKTCKLEFFIINLLWLGKRKFSRYLMIEVKITKEHKKTFKFEQLQIFIES